VNKWANRKLIIFVLLDLIMLGLAFGAGFVTAQIVPQRIQIPGLAPAPQLNLYWDVWRLVEQDFIHLVPDQQTRVYGAIRGSLMTLNDPYTVFVEPQSHQREKEDLQGRFGGIGVTMRRNDPGDLVFTPLPDSPAIKAGIQDGDVLLSVDGKTITSTMTFDDIAALVRGKVGTHVTIVVRRAREETLLSFTITRQEIQTPSVEARLLEQTPQIGYLAVRRFTERSGEEIRNAMLDLKQKGANQVILDLRDNGGGLLDASIDVATQFLPEGQVVLYEKQKDKPEKTFTTKSGGLAFDVQIVVLVNHGTASASEIVAGALRDQNRSVLIGDKTYGKGSVQHVYDLSDGSSLHVTAAEWFTPNRHQLTGNGLNPDVAVPRSNEDIAAGRDPQLDRAIAYLQNRP